MIKRKTLEEWLGTATRFLGILGLIYEVLVDHLKTPTALVVFGGLAGSPDVLAYWLSVRSQVGREIEDEKKVSEKEGKS